MIVILRLDRFVGDSLEIGSFVGDGRGLQIEPRMEMLLVQGSLVSKSMISNDGIQISALEMALRLLVIKICVRCHYLDGILENPHTMMVVCRFKPL